MEFLHKKMISQRINPLYSKIPIQTLRDIREFLSQNMTKNIGAQLTLSTKASLPEPATAILECLRMQTSKKSKVIFRQQLKAQTKKSSSTVSLKVETQIWLSKVNPNEYDLYMRVDTNTNGHRQWFYFSIKSKSKRMIKLNIFRFKKPYSLFQRGMRPYVRSIKQGQGWKPAGRSVQYIKERRNNKYGIRKDSNYFYLTFTYRFDFDEDEVFFAAGIPYSYSFLQKRLSNFSENRKTNIRFEVENLGKTMGGINLQIVKVEPENLKQSEPKKMIVINARTHSGETSGSWVLDGVLKALTNSQKIADWMQENNIYFRILPMMNPDGVFVGNYRTGIIGDDFNRKFLSGKSHTYPQIFALKSVVKEAKSEGIASLFIDLHGHSILKNSFFYGPEESDFKGHQVKKLPFYLWHASKYFRMPSCKFKAGKDKLETARVFFQMKENILSFTCENSLGLYSTHNKTIQMDSSDWQKFGQSLVNCIMETMQKSAEFKRDEQCQSNTDHHVNPKIKIIPADNNTETQKLMTLKAQGKVTEEISLKVNKVSPQVKRFIKTNQNETFSHNHSSSAAVEKVYGNIESAAMSNSAQQQKQAESKVEEQIDSNTTPSLFSDLKKRFPSLTAKSSLQNDSKKSDSLAKVEQSHYSGFFIKKIEEQTNIRQNRSKTLKERKSDSKNQRTTSNNKKSRLPAVSSTSVQNSQNSTRRQFYQLPKHKERDSKIALKTLEERNIKPHLQSFQIKKTNHLKTEKDISFSKEKNREMLKNYYGEEIGERLVRTTEAKHKAEGSTISPNKNASFKMRRHPVSSKISSGTHKRLSQEIGKNFTSIDNLREKIEQKSRHRRQSESCSNDPFSDKKISSAEKSLENNPFEVSLLGFRNKGKSKIDQPQRSITYDQSYLSSQIAKVNELDEQDYDQNGNFIRSGRSKEEEDAKEGDYPFGLDPWAIREKNQNSMSYFAEDIGQQESANDVQADQDEEESQRQQREIKDDKFSEELDDSINDSDSSSDDLPAKEKIYVLEYAKNAYKQQNTSHQPQNYSEESSSNSKSRQKLPEKTKIGSFKEIVFRSSLVNQKAENASQNYMEQQKETIKQIVASKIRKNPHKFKETLIATGNYCNYISLEKKVIAEEANVVNGVNMVKKKELNERGSSLPYQNRSLDRKKRKDPFVLISIKERLQNQH